MDEVHLTSQQVKDLAWLLSMASETLEASDTFKATVLAGMCEEAAFTLLDRLYGQEGPD